MPYAVQSKPFNLVLQRSHLLVIGITILAVNIFSEPNNLWPGFVTAGIVFSHLANRVRLCLIYEGWAVAQGILFFNRLCDQMSPHSHSGKWAITPLEVKVCSPCFIRQLCSLFSSTDILIMS